MVTCGALNCGNSSTKKSVADVKGWHNVPTEKENKQRRKKWLAAMKRDPPYPADTNFVLCGMHFTSECFQRDLKAELCGSVRKFILLPNAIPSVFSFSKRLFYNSGGHLLYFKNIYCKNFIHHLYNYTCSYTFYVSKSIPDSVYGTYTPSGCGYSLRITHTTHDGIGFR
ncbi:uncharacterized protein LOC130645964 [Hydractinia symbiolongicarpus]|uniref:uncharacterized protein LOC130645964 n=1 Tax=Hydractinia symbiolongicarpus TaxID=13093 RepID=UPI002549DE92|nr:uncharacterized protein LOC130645964 [Hydractinia symbiolongicarpus]